MTIIEDLVFIDVQGFKTNCNKFIAKEFCLVHGNFTFHDIVKSKCSRRDLMTCYRRETQWVTYLHHGLDFNCGNITLDELVEHTLDHVKGKRIYVKGCEKVEWVKDIYKKWCQIDCRNVENTDNAFKLIPKDYDEILSICPHHKHFLKTNDCHCALAIARELSEYFLDDKWLVVDKKVSNVSANISF